MASDDKSNLCRSIHPQSRRFSQIWFCFWCTSRTEEATSCTATAPGLEDFPRLLCCSSFTSQVLFPGTFDVSCLQSISLFSREIRGIDLTQKKATLSDCLLLSLPLTSPAFVFLINKEVNKSLNFVLSLYISHFHFNFLPPTSPQVKVCLPCSLPGLLVLSSISGVCCV